MSGRPKEKAPFVCGCMGTTHKPVNNCLNCGRIVCQNEGRDNCLACGQELIPIMSAEEATQNGHSPATVAAYKLKVISFDFLVHVNNVNYIYVFIVLPNLL